MSRASVFEVANIRDKRTSSKKGVEYLIRWKGYGADQDSWEPVANIISGAEEIIDEYNARHGKSGEKPTRTRSTRGRSRSKSPDKPARTASRSKSRGSVSRTSSTGSAKKSASKSSSKVSQPSEDEDDNSNVSRTSSSASKRGRRATEQTPERSLSRTRTAILESQPSDSSHTATRSTSTTSSASKRSSSNVSHSSTTTSTSSESQAEIHPAAKSSQTADHVFSALLPGCILYLIVAIFAHSLVLITTETRFESGITRRLVAWTLFSEKAAQDIFNVVMKNLRLFEIASLPLYLLANSVLRRYTRLAWSNENVADKRASQLSGILHGIACCFSLWFLHHYNLWASVAGVKLIATVMFSYYLSEQILNCRTHTTPARLQYTAIIALSAWLIFAGYFKQSKDAEAAGSIAVQQAYFYGFIFVICAETMKFESQLIGSTQSVKSPIYQLTNALLHALYIGAVVAFTIFYFNNAVWLKASHKQLSFIQALSADVFIFINAAASILDQEHWRNIQH